MQKIYTELIKGSLQGELFYVGHGTLSVPVTHPGRFKM